MRTKDEIIINGKTLTQILDDHKHFVNEDCGNWINMKADLEGADLSYVNLDGAYLKFANLHGANLYAVNLNGANLYGVNLNGANLKFANVKYANLECANLERAKLMYADLHGANLECADLERANLMDADLHGANLECANLCDTNLMDVNLISSDLTRANLTNADLKNANLDGSNLADAILDTNELIRKGCILKNPMIGWKKCKYDVIVKLEIPCGAIVFSINNNKCRTNMAKVLEVIGADMAFSIYTGNFTYETGQEIFIDDFNCMYNIECGAGIHFFRTQEEAENFLF